MAMLNGRIVKHLEDPAGSNRAACNGEPIEDYPEFMERQYGFVFCEACRLRAMKAL